MAVIRKNGKGYLVDYSVRIGNRSWRERVYGFKTKAEAEGFRNQLLLRPLDQKIGFQAPSTVLIQTAIDQYKTLVSIKKASYGLEKQYFERFTEFFENQRQFDGLLASISLMHMQELQLALQNRLYTRGKVSEDKVKESTIKQGKNIKRKVTQLSNSTVNRHFNTYRNFFEQCRRWNYINKSPCEFLKDLPEKSKVKKIWPPEAIVAVLQELPHWALRIVYFLAKTGARRQQAINLTIEDVNLHERIVSLKSRKGSGEEKITTIPLTDDVKAFITEQFEIVKKQKARHLFPDDKGNRIKPVRLSTLIHRKAKTAGYAGMNLHALRHTIATQLVSANTNIRKVQKLLGHASLNTTMQYTNKVDEDMRGDMESLEDTIKIRLPLSANGHIRPGGK